MKVSSYLLDSCFLYFNYVFIYLPSSNFRLSFPGHVTHRDNVKFRKEHPPNLVSLKPAQLREEMALGYWQWILGSWEEGDGSEREESWAGRWWKPWVKEGRECCLQPHFIPPTPPASLHFLENGTESQKAHGEAGLDYSVMKWQKAERLNSEWFGESSCRDFCFKTSLLINW